jgi:hypothetical protein
MKLEVGLVKQHGSWCARRTRPSTLEELRREVKQHLRRSEALQRVVHDDLRAELTALAEEMEAILLRLDLAFAAPIRTQ